MAIKSGFRLTLKDGFQANTIEELREHFDLQLIIGYAHDRRLGNWLNSRKLKQEAEALAALDENGQDFPQQLCSILGVEVTQTQVNAVATENIIFLSEQKQKLRQLTDNPAYLDKAEAAAFSDEDVARLLSKGCKEILLCNGSFLIPLDKPCKYIGVGKAEAVIKKCVDLEAKGITFGEGIKVTDEQGNPYASKNEQNKSESGAVQSDEKHGSVSEEMDRPVEASTQEDILELCTICQKIGKRQLEVSHAREVEITRALYIAAQNGNAQAMYGMYLAYKYGLGDFVLMVENAQRWLKKAKENGFDVSQAKRHGGGKGKQKQNHAGNNAQHQNNSVKPRQQNNNHVKPVQQNPQPVYSDVNTLMAQAKALAEENKYNESKALYTQAAEMGSVEAMRSLANLYESEDNMAEAKKWLTKAANTGDISCINRLAFFYFLWEDNAAEAKKWYMKAANKGDMEAMRLLGDTYQSEDNLAEAKKWYMKAANLGDGMAMNRIGLYYAANENYASAADWYKKSAQVGCDWGMRNYAYYLRYGIGVGENSNEALKYYLKAAEKGNTMAMCDLVTWPNAYGSYDKNAMFNMLQNAVKENENDDSALYGLSVLYKGRGNEKKALDLRLRAAAKGNGDAKNEVEKKSFKEFAFAVQEYAPYVSEDAKCYFQQSGKIPTNERRIKFLTSEYQISSNNIILYLEDDSNLTETCRFALVDNGSGYLIGCESFGEDAKWIDSDEVISIDSVSAPASPGSSIMGTMGKAAAGYLFGGVVGAVVASSIGSSDKSEHIDITYKGGSYQLTTRTFGNIALGCILKLACGLPEQLSQQEYALASQIRLRERGNKTILEDLEEA